MSYSCTWVIEIVHDRATLGSPSGAVQAHMCETAPVKIVGDDVQSGCHGAEEEHLSMAWIGHKIVI